MKENESLDPVTVGTFGMNRVMLDLLNSANFKQNVYFFYLLVALSTC